MKDIEDELDILYATKEDLEHDLFLIKKEIESLELKLDGAICTRCNGNTLERNLWE